VNSDIFCCLFFLYETTHFSQNSVVSYIAHENKTKGTETVLFCWHYGSSSSPGRTTQGKKKIFSFSVTAISLFKKMSSPSQKYADQPHLPINTFHMLEGRHHIAPPQSVSCFLPIKTGEERAEKKGEKKKKSESKKEGGRKEETRKKKEKKEQKKGKKKQREKKEKEQHRRPPQPPATTSSTVATTTASSTASMPPQVSLPSFFSFAASLHCSHSM
jgi:hypothetical protein